MFAATFGDPSEEPARAHPFGPHETEEFSCVGIRGGGTEEGFHAPAKIRAVPRLKPIAFRNDPVVAKRVQHNVLAICVGWHIAEF